MNMRRPPHRPEESTDGILAEQGQSNANVERKMHSSIITLRSRRATLISLAFAATVLCYVLLSGENDSETTRPLEKNQHVRKRFKDSDDPCTIWFAPSSVKGLDGFGIFTTRSIHVGDKMLSGGPDGPSIPVIDYIRGPWTKTMNEYWCVR